VLRFTSASSVALVLVAAAGMFSGAVCCFPLGLVDIISLISQQVLITLLRIIHAVLSSAQLDERVLAVRTKHTRLQATHYALALCKNAIKNGGFLTIYFSLHSYRLLLLREEY
jgi:hypothetical protein